MNSHTIEYLAPGLVKQRTRAWHKKSRDQLDAACRLLEKDGVIEPPLIDSEDRIVCGGTIVLAAQKLGLATIPVLRVNNMSPEELRLYAINAHKLADMAGYDDALLAEELRELEQLLGEESLKVMAIAEGELTQLLGLARSLEDEDDPGKLMDEVNEPITRPDDLWLIGPHRLLCGNSLVDTSFIALMVGEKAQFGFTDMPYNLKMKDISSNPDRDEFAFAHGELSPQAFTRFQTTFMRHMQEWSEPGSLHAFFMSYHFLPELFRAGMIVFGRPKAMCTWVKSQGGQGSLFRSQTEQIVYFKNGEAPHRNNVMLGKHKRNRTTAWHYDGMTTVSAERNELLKSHATPKPVMLLKDAILDVTSRGGIVLDPFAGIGSIILAAHSAERRAYAIEIEPKFVDVAIRRMRSAYGVDATREADGKSFAELEAARLEEANQ